MVFFKGPAWFTVATLLEAATQHNADPVLRVPGEFHIVCVDTQKFFDHVTH